MKRIMNIDVNIGTYSPNYTFSENGYLLIHLGAQQALGRGLINNLEIIISRNWTGIHFFETFLTKVKKGDTLCFQGVESYGESPNVHAYVYYMPFKR